MNSAGFWRRLAAYLLDIIPIVLLTAGVFYFFLGFDETWSAYWENRSLENRIKFLDERNLIRDSSFVIWLLYCIALEASPLQGTVGKVVCGIKVVDLDGNRLTYLRSTGRNFAKLISYIPLALGFLWAAFSKKKQAWHDIFAKTLVIIK